MDVDWEQTFVEADAIWSYREGGPHALYELSGRHSDFYFNTNSIVSRPPLLKRAVIELTRRLRVAGMPPAWIVTYPPFGLPVGFAMAEALASRFAYVHSLDRAELYFPIPAAASVLLVADDLYSGGSVRKVLAVLRQLEVSVLPSIVVLANFSGSSTFDGMPVVSLYERSIPLWSPGECPLCLKGSLPVAARPHWSDLQGTR